MAYLKQIYCDGSITTLIETSVGPHHATLEVYDNAGNIEGVLDVAPGYLQSKVEVMRLSGNEDKILEWRS